MNFYVSMIFITIWRIKIIFIFPVNRMYVIRKVRGKYPYKQKNAVPAKSSTVSASQIPAPIPTIDVEQSGSGMKGIQNKMKTIYAISLIIFSMMTAFSQNKKEQIEQLNYSLIPLSFYSIYNNSQKFSNINKVFFYSSLYYHDSLFAIKTDGSLISHGSIINGAGSIIALKISNFPTINFTLYQNNELEINNLIDMVSINNYSGILLSNIGLRSDGKVVIWGYYITNIIDTNTDFFNNNSHITTVNNNTVGNYIEVKNYLIPDNGIVLIDSDYYNMKHNLTEIIKIYSNNENIFIL